MPTRTRLRLGYASWPLPRIVLTDTPRPNCPDCQGRGGFLTGSPGSDEPDDVACGCWDPANVRTVCRVPRPIARRLLGYVDPDPNAVSPF